MGSALNTLAPLLSLSIEINPKKKIEIGPIAINRRKSKRRRIKTPSTMSRILRKINSLRTIMSNGSRNKLLTHPTRF